MAREMVFKSFVDDRGSLCAIEELKDIPFDVRRIFYIYGTKSNLVRGGHAHKKTHMCLIGLHGISSITVKHADHSVQEFQLDVPTKGLLLEPSDWHEMRFSDGAVLLVLASTTFDAEDYVYECPNIGNQKI